MRVSWGILSGRTNLRVANWSLRGHLTHPILQASNIAESLRDLLSTTRCWRQTIVSTLLQQQSNFPSFYPQCITLNEIKQQIWKVIPKYTNENVPAMFAITASKNKQSGKFWLCLLKNTNRMFSHMFNMLIFGQCSVIRLIVYFYNVLKRKPDAI